MTEKQEQQMAADREELRARILQAVPSDGALHPLEGLKLYRVSRSAGPVHGVASPALCLVVQGRKELLLGDDVFRYDPYHYLLVALDLPTVTHITEASPERPFLGLVLDLDPGLVSSVLVEAGHVASRRADARAMNVSRLPAELLDALVRLVRLAEDRHEARVLAPLTIREIVFRLLMGEQGDRLRHLAVLGGQGQRIARAVERIRDDFDQPLRIDALASELGMSVSGFHAHFKAVTAMSPLQYLKRLRLQEARRLMLSEGLDAAGAGYRVGYEDASQFSREYRRHFGAPPMRDVERLREAAAAG